MNLSEELVLVLLQSDKEFPVDFDDAWQWLEFSTKGNAKRSFENAGFVDGIDFEVFIQNDKNPLGGRPEQIIYLTIDCFKTWAMMVNTDKGKQVRRYFLNCEKRLKEILEEQYRTQQNQKRKTLIGKMVSDGIVSRYPKFDLEFYEMLYRKRGNGWEERSPENRPSCVAHWTNETVYDRLLGGTDVGGVKDTLNTVNPSVNGSRKHRHHWHLKELGEYHLNTHFEHLKIIDRLTPDGGWEKFMYSVKKGIPNGEPLQLHLWDIYENMDKDTESSS